MLGGYDGIPDSRLQVWRTGPRPGAEDEDDGDGDGDGPGKSILDGVCGACEFISGPGGVVVVLLGFG